MVSEPVRREVLAKCNPCVSSPCKNDAICELEAGGKFTCNCLPGYHGKLCEHMIDACYGNPCRSGGSCKLLEEGRFRLVGRDLCADFFMLKSSLVIFMWRRI